MDKEIYLKHIHQTENSTVGDLTYEGLHQCYIIENGYHNPKIKNISRIWEGRHKLVFRTEGDHYDRYKEMYGDWFKGMIEVDIKMDLNNDHFPDFDFILFHKGNFAFMGKKNEAGEFCGDTKGCLLPNTTYSLNNETECYQGQGSTKATEDFYKLMTPLMEEFDCFINIS